MSGRPRSPELEKRLLAAAWALLTTEGYDALKLTSVAAQAGAYGTDVYRRWSSKAQLVTAALSEHLPPVSEVDTGSLRSDLRAYTGDLAVSWSAPWIDGLMGLMADLHRDPEAEAAFRQMGERRGQVLRNALARAVQRGEIEQPSELFLIGDVLEGPLMHRRMVARLPLTPEFLEAVVASAHQVLTRSAVPT